MLKWAGKFLISLKAKHKTWDEAISRYHSNTMEKKTIFSQSNE